MSKRQRTEEENRRIILEEVMTDLLASNE